MMLRVLEGAEIGCEVGMVKMAKFLVSAGYRRPTAPCRSLTVPAQRIRVFLSTYRRPTVRWRRLTVGSGQLVSVGFKIGVKLFYTIPIHFQYVINHVKPELVHKYLKSLKLCDLT